MLPAVDSYRWYKGSCLASLPFGLFVEISNEHAAPMVFRRGIGNSICDDERGQTSNRVILSVQRREEIPAACNESSVVTVSQNRSQP